MHAIALVIAIAAQVAPVPVKPAPRVTHIDVDEDVIEASPLGPKDTVVLAKQPHVFRSLIKVRASFAPELLASAAQLAR